MTSFDPKVQRPRVRALIMAALAALAGAACATPTAPPNTAQQAMTRLQTVIGDARCQSDGECRSVAAGQRACGGPDSYLAWSAQRSSAEAVESAVAAFNAANLPTLPGQTASICVFLHDPGTYCRRGSDGAGQCKLRPGVGPPGAGSPTTPVR